MVAIRGTKNGRRFELAPSLVALVAEADRLAPGRATGSDGSIASGAHSVQNPDSDHEVGARDLVHAVDLTDSPVTGWEGAVRRSQIIANRDPRVRYIIGDDTIWRGYDRPATASRPFLAAWEPEDYTGQNEHWGHDHISIWSTPEAENDTSPWFNDGDDMTPQQLEALIQAVYGASREQQDALANAGARDASNLAKTLGAKLDKQAVAIDRLAASLDKLAAKLDG